MGQKILKMSPKKMVMTYSAWELGDEHWAREAIDRYESINRFIDDMKLIQMSQ